MKKIILVMISLLFINAVALCAEEETATEEETTISAAEASPAAMTKGESFMAAFGMGDSGVIDGGESGGSTGGAASSVGAVAAAHATAHVGSTALTSPQNTPYTYK